jgi:hypothetical protein
MRKLLLVLDGTMLAVATLAGVAVLLWPEDPRLARSRFIDREHFNRLEVGMRQGEVESVLGGPPGSFDSEQVSYWEGTQDDQIGTEWGGVDRVERWTGNKGRVEVFFTDEGTVRGARFWWPVRSPPPLAERIRDWLRRLWA